MSLGSPPITYTVAPLVGYSDVHIMPQPSPLSLFGHKITLGLKLCHIYISPAPPVQTSMEKSRISHAPKMLPGIAWWGCSVKFSQTKALSPKYHLQSLWFLLLFGSLSLQTLWEWSFSGNWKVWSVHAHQAPKTDWGTLTQPQVPPRSQQAPILLLWTRSVYPRFLWRKLALSLLTCEAKDELNIHQNRDQLNTGWTLLCETLRE